MTTLVFAAIGQVRDMFAQNPPSQLLNISTRLPVQAGDNVLIGGFIITGTEPKKVIIRAIGPSLAQFTNGPLADPTLELYQGNTLLASNDNWKTRPDGSSQRAEIEATTIPPTNDLESALVRTLAPGAYTAVVRGKDGSIGIGLVEAYDLNQAANSTLANISTRGFVDTGNNVMIGGFIVGPAGGAGTNFVVRAIGPSLTAFGVPGALQDPTLTIYNANGSVLREDDDWQDAQPAEIGTIGLQPNDSREAAVLVSFVPGNYTAIVRGKGNLTGVSLVEIYHVPAPPPVVIPDPVDRAPAPPISSVGDFYDSTSFLYNNAKPVQFGVKPGIITATAAAVIRGSVKDDSGQPLGGVRVAIQGRPEYGYTFTRADGQYDIAVNGGRVENVDYEATGYLSVHREVQVPQQDFVRAGDVVMIKLDSMATKVTVGANAPVQVANSSAQSDAAGNRSATMYFPAGTGAQLLYADGTTQTIDTLTIRATEYTVGSSGPAKMPASLPGGSAYTYCVELSADEVMNASAKSVVFDKELSVYVDNYLGFPVGTLVPSGYYDREKTAWVPAENGIVAKVVSITNGVAGLDLDGDGVAETDDTLSSDGISISERERIAARFSVGQTFWRMPVTHFSSWDYNYPPLATDLKNPPGNNPPPLPTDNTQKGFGELGLASQVFKEELPVAGTKMSLHYASDRVPGYRVNATIELPLIGDSIPQNLHGADVEVEIAGRTSTQTFTPQTNLVAFFQWDGRDVYHPQSGSSTSPVGGSATAQVTLAYRYPDSYALRSIQAGKNAVQSGITPASGMAAPNIRALTPTFALAGTEPSAVVHNGGEDAILSKFTRVLTVPDHRKAGLDGWSLTPHHFYDPTAKILYRGDGQQVKAKPQKLDFLYRAARNFGLYAMAVRSDGDTYVSPGNQIFKITASGQLVPVTAALNTPGKLNFAYFDPDLDNRLAADVAVSGYPDEMRAGPDGSIYLAYFDTIWRLDRDDRFHLVLCGASTSQRNTFVPDGTSARNAYRDSNGPNHIAIAKDGSVYYTDGHFDAAGKFLDLIRKIAPDGRIYTIAGLGGRPDFGDVQNAGNVDLGGQALTARMEQPTSMAVGPDDSLYYTSYRFGIVHIKKDGILELVLFGHPNNPAGLNNPIDSDEGKVAVTAGSAGPNSASSSLHVTADGTLYFYAIQCSGPTCNPTVWKIDPDGILRRIAGRWFPTPGQTGNALEADGGIITDLGFAPDGSLYLVGYEQTDNVLTSIRKISGSLPGFGASELTVASEDGQELYVFDQNGRHLRTIDPLLNVTTWTFSYDSRGFIASLQDRDGLLTIVERDSAGHATAIVGPYGTRTALTVDSNGYLAAVTAPDQTKIQMTNSATGLLNAITGPRQDTYSFTYDDMGRLTRGNHPSGGFTTLARSGSTPDATITATTAGGRIETRRVQRTDAGGTLTTLTNPDEAPSTENKLPDGSRILNDLPSFQEEIDLAPDPRPGIASQASYPNLRRFTTPRGLKTEITSSQQATLSDQANPLSLTNFVDRTSINGNQWTSSYEAATRTFNLGSPEGRLASLQINAAGRSSSSKQGNLAQETFSYDNSGRLTTFTVGSGSDARMATIGYDAGGYQNFRHAPDGREAQIINDVFGQPTSVILPGNRTVGFTYGVDGRLESVTPPNRPSYTYQYDVASGRITYKTPVLAGVDNTTIFDQTLDRQFKSLTLPGDRHIDALRRPSGKIASISNTFGDTFTYSYNTLGQPFGINQQGGQTVALGYIGLDIANITYSGGVAGSLTRQLNNDLRISAEAVNGETPVPFGYDHDGLMISAGALAITWRSDVGLPLSTKAGNVTTAYDYDAFGYPVHVTANYSNAILLDINETRDRVGRVLTRASANANTSYVYDNAGDLASVTENGTLVATYSYDSNGNISSAVTPTGSTSYTYDAQDRLLTAGATGFTYTDAGELKTRVAPNGTTGYIYDEFGQLRHVSLPDGRNIDYVLGTPAICIAKKINGVVMQGFLRDEKGDILAELDGNNAVVSRFVYSQISETPAYMVRGSDTFRFITDSLGSVRLVVNTQSGAVAQRIEYDEWGQITLDSNPGFQPFGFAGGIYDKDTGLVRFGARDYDPSVRRWTSPDPIKFHGGSTNLYAYAGNDPINGRDPSGTGPLSPRALQALQNSRRASISINEGINADAQASARAYGLAARVGQIGSSAVALVSGAAAFQASFQGFAAVSSLGAFSAEGAVVQTAGFTGGLFGITASAANLITAAQTPLNQNVNLAPTTIKDVVLQSALPAAAAKAASVAITVSKGGPNAVVAAARYLAGR